MDTSSTYADGAAAASVDDQRNEHRSRDPYQYGLQAAATAFSPQNTYMVPALHDNHISNQPSLSSWSRDHASMPDGYTVVPPEVQRLLHDLFSARITADQIPHEYWPSLQAICDQSSTLYVGRDSSPIHAQATTRVMPMEDAPYATSNPGPSGANPQPSPTASFAWADPTVVTDVSAPREETMHCHWGDCNREIMSTRFSAIESHLKQFHFPDSEGHSWEPGMRGRCMWRNCTWQQPMYHRSLAKHIATQHLRSTAAICSDCGETFTRADSRNRHAHLRHGTRSYSAGETTFSLPLMDF